VLANTSGFVYYVSVTGITGAAAPDASRVGDAVAQRGAGGRQFEGQFDRAGAARHLHTILVRPISGFWLSQPSTLGR